MIASLLAFLVASTLLLSLQAAPILPASLLNVLPTSPQYQTSYERVRGIPYTVGYDERAIIVNGERVLLLSGSIHYPRFAPGEWAHQFNLTRLSGLNTVQTYVSAPAADITHSLPKETPPKPCRILMSSSAPPFVFSFWNCQTLSCCLLSAWACSVCQRGG